MSDIAAHLVDEVLPEVPIRQWVCSLPWRLRYAMGYDRELCAEVLAAFIGALRRSLRRQLLHHVADLVGVPRGAHASIKIEPRADVLDITIRQERGHVEDQLGIGLSQDRLAAQFGDRLAEDPRVRLEADQLGIEIVSDAIARRAGLRGVVIVKARQTTKLVPAAPRQH